MDNFRSFNKSHENNSSTSFDKDRLDDKETTSGRKLLPANKDNSTKDTLLVIRKSDNDNCMKYMILVSRKINKHNSMKDTLLVNRKYDTCK